jgi:hypothetical protein
MENTRLYRKGNRSDDADDRKGREYIGRARMMMSFFALTGAEDHSSIEA